jgi:hypothetical protein
MKFDSGVTTKGSRPDNLSGGKFFIVLWFLFPLWRGIKGEDYEVLVINLNPSSWEK